MEKHYFSNKIYCELTIVSDTTSPEQITKMLDINSHRSFSKGDTYKSKHSGSLITRPHNLWAVSSKEAISEEQDITSHILQLKSLLDRGINGLKELKKDDNVELTLTLWFETEDAGIGIDIFESEISFILDIANRIHISVVADTEIVDEIL